MHLFLSIWFNLLSFFLIPFLTSSSPHLSLMSFPPAKLTHPLVSLILLASVFAGQAALLWAY